MSERDSNRRLVAILRGITPAETEAVVEGLIGAGFDAIEIPLNSPTPFESIRIAAAVAARQGGPARLIGAGTVLSPDDVDRVRENGGNLIVAPNMDRAVITRALDLGLTMIPGVMTPTEALAAIDAGARDLKIFPASLLGPAGIAAMRAVLPDGIRLYAVGGVGADDFAAYADAGVHGFGLGSSLFKPGHEAADVAANAVICMKAMQRIHGGG
ncbi:MAG: 2-dehydro-3-deoxy-6-phosphogalactonate aldolase [Rhodobiaceae bacterium]|jgi:2-dehydro-3-deoxyphosphogalactonate aldolase